MLDFVVVLIIVVTVIVVVIVVLGVLLMVFIVVIVDMNIVSELPRLEEVKMLLIPVELVGI